MIAETTAVIEPGGVLGELACVPPLTLRQVRKNRGGLNKCPAPLATIKITMAVPGTRL